MAAAERKPIVPSSSGKVEPESSMIDQIAQVLQLVQKEAPLSKKQVAFCDDACVERYLKARGNNCRRAARLLKATLNWREKINIGYLIADEFPAELAAGSAYVAGFDDDGRPVLIIKKKPDHITNHTQKQYLRFVIFTLEVAVAAMPPGVDQWVLILDAGGYSRISGPSPSGILATLKILADHYPERLAKAFIVDASSMFYFVWKGICTFVDHSTRGKLSFAYLKDYRLPLKPQQALKVTPPSSPTTPSPQQACFPDNSRLPSSTYNSTPGQFWSSGEIPHSPLYDTHSPEISMNDFGDEPELISSVRQRSFSFSSATDPTQHLPEPKEECSANSIKDNLLVSNSDVPVSVPARTRRQKAPSSDGSLSIQHSKKSPGGLLEEHGNRGVNMFQPYLKFLLAPYDQATYRALMKPPLGGLASIISRDLKYQYDS
ncbi:unnamed protein product [Sphagnum jensenii]|uniref:CRAL-TRIO domain-containing protein n=1 Tax=Sphagnum jensenii TaxID=128206 RepID=A0ABP0XDZ1_9BRYO